MRLAKTLEGAEGLESANANLMGQVQLSYDDERTTRDALVEPAWLAAASASSCSSSGDASRAGLRRAVVDAVARARRWPPTEAESRRASTAPRSAPRVAAPVRSVSAFSVVGIRVDDVHLDQPVVQLAPRSRRTASPSTFGESLDDVLRRPSRAARRRARAGTPSGSHAAS